jgi:hypothetical protein
VRPVRSGSGTLRTWRGARLESAFGGRAEVRFRSRQVAFGPEPDITEPFQGLYWVATMGIETRGISMKRREFITLVCGAVAWPLAARARREGKLPTIGFLIGGTPASDRLWVDVFVKHLSELGWVEGTNVHIEYRSAEGRPERYTEIAAEFVRMPVDIILTSGAAAVAAVKQATSQIPIVFAAVGDAVGGGLVASLARPGGNLTGLSLQFSDLAGKRVELLRELLPGLRRLGILSNASSPSAVLEMHEAQLAARTLGLDVVTPTVERLEDTSPRGTKRHFVRCSDMSEVGVDRKRPADGQ